MINSLWTWTWVSASQHCGKIATVAWWWCKTCTRLRLTSLILEQHCSKVASASAPNIFVEIRHIFACASAGSLAEDFASQSSLAPWPPTAKALETPPWQHERHRGGKMEHQWYMVYAVQTFRLIPTLLLSITKYILMTSNYYCHLLSYSLPVSGC